MDEEEERGAQATAGAVAVLVTRAMRNGIRI
jgi:hypothetical protein